MHPSTAPRLAASARQLRLSRGSLRAQDWLVQWDHGAPGVSATLLRAWRAFGDARYKTSALRALEVTWHRGLVLKGLMNCHGMGGTTWMQVRADKPNPPRDPPC